MLSWAWAPCFLRLAAAKVSSTLTSLCMTPNALYHHISIKDPVRLTAWQSVNWGNRLNLASSTILFSRPKLSPAQFSFQPTNALVRYRLMPNIISRLKKQEKVSQCRRKFSIYPKKWPSIKYPPINGDWFYRSSELVIQTKITSNIVD